MKKLLVLALSAFMFTATSQAQKQEGGENNLELQFAPLSGSPFKMDGGFRYRKFLGASNALRIGFLVGMTSNTDITQQADKPATGDPELTTKTSAFNLSIRPGFEHHMEGTENLSPYMGGELAVNLGTTKKVEEGENQDGSQSINTTTTSGGSFGFGINLVLGADYYFAKHIYIGAELGFGFSMTSVSDDKVEYSGFEPSNPDATTTKNGSSFQLGPIVQPTMRAGWLF